jgi:AMP phosphorylase
MKLKAKRLDLDAGGKTVILMNKEDADELGVHPLDRVIVSNSKKEVTAVVNISQNFVKQGSILAYAEVADHLSMDGQKEVDVRRREDLLSKKSIKRKINGSKLREEEIQEIIKDVVCHNLNDLEISAFVTALTIRGMTQEEIVSLTRAMSGSGKTLDFKKKPILDKHSLGGCPGDKTTMLLVPIIAAAGFTIPKTSSRAITSPAGTADRFESLANVNLSIEEMKRVVRKTNACIVWGGALDMAPADDLFIKIEYPLGLDPLYIPSIMSKKKSVNATHLVIDIPTGRGTKVKTFGDAYEVASEFIGVGKRIGIKTTCGITFGEQPIGHCIGPILEAREALEIISNPKINDVTEKACSLAGILMEMIGKGNKETAYRILKSGKAEKKLREIIAAQSGNEKIKPSDLHPGDKTVVIRTPIKGTVMWIKNHCIAEAAKLAGAPKDKGAGIILHAKIGSVVKVNEPLLTIYASKTTKLNEAEKFIKEAEPLVVVEDATKLMSVTKIEKEKSESYFSLDR